MSWFPEVPSVPATQCAAAESVLRYEDVSQDGRLNLLGLPHTIGDVIWRKLFVNHPATKAAREGIVSVLTRFVIEGGDGPISVRHSLTGDGCYDVSHTVDEKGEPNRILINMWVNARAPRGRTHGPPPAGAGEPIFVGRVFAEHVLTRLFASPEQRKVTRLNIEGLPEVPPHRWTWRPVEAVLALPSGAQWLDAAASADVAPVVFGLNHTDSNQHVNSLVYPRLFQEAALRRFAERGLDSRVLARRLEIAYRKPCFAGQRVEIRLQAYRTPGGGVGAVGTFMPEGQGTSARPHCTVNMEFAP